MTNCVTKCAEHSKLRARREKSTALLLRVREAFAAKDFFNDLPISVFCAGSLARQEVGAKSDLDLFVTAEQNAPQSRLFEYTLFAELIDINRACGFSEFSNDGHYLRIHRLADLITVTGSPRDDSDNLFTTRMLLVLESRPLLHDAIYDEHLQAVLDNYYRDKHGTKSFRPLFLLNDLLRYWRTLCLNYEERRLDPEKPWRKKNVNLRFSRMITVFGTVLPLVLRSVGTAQELAVLCRHTPLERLAGAMDLLDDRDLDQQWSDVLDLYEEYLTWKDDEDVERYLEGGDQKKRVRQHAQTLSKFLHAALTHAKLDPELRRYLVL